MKKILFVIRSLEFGGAEKSLVNLLRQLPRDRYAIDLLLFKKKGDFLKQLPDSVRVLDTPDALGRLFAPLRRAGKYGVTKLLGTGCARLAEKTRKARMAYRWRHFYKKAVGALPGSYDVAVAYVGTEVLYYVADCVTAEKKYVWIHNDYRTAAYSKKDDLPYFTAVDGIVSVSRDCVKVLCEEFPQFQNKIHCVENITASNVIRELAQQGDAPEFQRDTCNILSVGRLSRQKGFDMAIEACAELKKQGLRFCWYVIGEGDQRQKLEERILRYDVADCFRLLGTRSNPYPYMQRCSFLAQPSRFEGKSVVLDEAKILATPILATAYHTVNDQLCNGDEGIIVPLSVEGICQGVSRLIREPETADHIRKFLSAREYGNAEQVEKYMTLLDG